MVRIKSTSEIADKWSSVTPGRAQFYKSGVEASGVQWEENTADASDAYASGVTQAIAEDRFSRGVRAAGNEKWRRKSSEVGAGRFGPGVQAAKSDYEKGFAPYRETISAIELPSRGARGDPQNYQRVSAIGDALHRQRIGQ